MKMYRFAMQNHIFLPIKGFVDFRAGRANSIGGVPEHIESGEPGEPTVSPVSSVPAARARRQAGRVDLQILRPEI